MSKNSFLCIGLLISLTMCSRNSVLSSEKSNNEVINDSEITVNNEITIDNETNDSKFNIDIDIFSLELLGINKANVYIRDTNNNKFIGYIDISEVYPEIHIGDIFIYEKYIVLEEFFQHEGKWFMGGFCVYEYDEELKIMEYKNLGNKLYDCIGEPYWFKGINNDLLFIDIGTGPGTRGIKIFDLANNINLLDASYNNYFTFSNNIVSGLVLTEWNIRNTVYDDNVIKMFNNYKQETAMPEETNGLYPEFILAYKYNIITKEIDIISGKYILTQ